MGVNDGVGGGSKGGHGYGRADRGSICISSRTGVLLTLAEAVLQIVG